jgi:homoserine kinase
MQKVKITLPATITNLGPGLNSLGLALGMHTIVEIVERTDHQLVVEPTGEGAGRYSVGLQHPVVLGLMRIFQQVERAPLGMTIRIENRIPLASGLGAEAAFWVAGVIGANNLLNNPFPRKDVLRLVAQFSQQPDHAITTILGGLTASMGSQSELHYHSLPVAALRIVLALPEIRNYPANPQAVLPERVPTADALYNLSRLPLLLDALRAGDYERLGKSMSDHLFTPALRSRIPGFDRVVEAAREAGAAAASISGRGPALVFFTESKQRDVASAVEAAFDGVKVKARTWILPVDMQGLVLSVAQSG